MKSRAQRYRYVRHVVSGTRPSPWSPLSLGSSLAAWYKADAGCYTDAACLFTRASSQYLLKTSPTFAPTNKMTLAFDYKPTTVGDIQDLVRRWTAGNANSQFVFWMETSGALTLYVADSLTDTGNNYARTTETLTAGSNARIVVVYDGTLAAGSRVAVYINGVAATMTVTGTIPTALTASTADIHIGGLTGPVASDGAMARLGLSSLALSGAALTAAHTSTFWADMTSARQSDWFSFYNLCEASGTRVDSTGLNSLTPTNGPTVAAGPGEGLCVDNSPVKRWEDQSGSSHFTQSDITKQPIYLTGILNARPVVRFNGTAHTMSCASVLDYSQSTIGAVANLSSGAGYQVLVSIRNQALYASLSVAVNWGGYNNAEVPSGVALTSAHAAIIQLTRAANDVDMYHNEAKATVSSGSAYDARDMHLGAANGNSQYHTGDVAELLIANDDVTASDAISMSRYFKSRYAVY